MSTWAFVGDSVTAAHRDRRRPDDLGRGWVADVAGRLQRADPAARTVNLGVPGNRVADVRDRVVADLTTARALVPGVVVTLAVGVNDVRRAHLDGVPFDLRGFARTYASVLPRVLTAVPGGDVRLLLVEPVLAPLDQAQAEWVADLDAVRDYVARAAEAHGAALVRPGEQFARSEPRVVTGDGIHPTRAGHRLVADAWWEAASAVPDLLPAAGPGDGPRWWDRVRLRLGRG